MATLGGLLLPGLGLSLRQALDKFEKFADRAIKQPAQKMSEKLLTVAEAATTLRVHPVTLRALAAAGPRTLLSRGRRRRQGEYMSLYKRPNSRYWWAKISLPDEGCVCRSSGTANRKEAQEWFDRLRAELWRVHRLGGVPLTRGRGT